VWGIVAQRTDVKVFFLACVIVAGVFGAVTAKPSIFFMQALPAILAFGAVLVSAKKLSAAT
jgi:putative membrane protein